jgi:hypothetical protein
MISKMIETYKQAGSNMYMRPLERFRELIKPWHMEKDFISMLDWHGFDRSEMTPEEMALAGPGGGNYGVYLLK